MDRLAFINATTALGLSLSNEQATQFEAYEERLYVANRVKNYTRVPQEQAWLRHFIDSLLFHDLFPQGAQVLDVGSGPGLPAWPLACARPDLRVTAMDSNAKMLGFLEQNPLPNLSVHLGRAEDWGVQEQFDVVTGRAVATLPVQLEIGAAMCRVGGALAPMRTAKDRSVDPGAVRELGLELESVTVRTFEGLDVPRALPVYRKVATTPSRFPRRWADLLKKPLPETSSLLGAG